MFMRLASATLSLLLAATLADAAVAGDLQRSPGAPAAYAPIKKQVIVSTSGLNLANPADAQVFVRRLSLAIDRACEDRSMSAPPLVAGRSAGFQACRTEALEEANGLVHAPAVKASMAKLVGHEAVRLADR